ncbi:MAG: cell division protein [Alphaproteobacteria bacterium]|nr:cell division protein [Alphaproteobacteria bacterium]|tara:strand:+ start:1404 stop:2291 length:888 start_codon:yes stop_codon:yes gene_type:complete
MFARRVDLAPNRDGTSRFLPWIIGLMVYLAGLALSATMVLEQVIDRWSAGLKRSITIVVDPSVDGGDAETDARIEAALSVILTTPGVLSATPLAPDEVAHLIEPWLGKDLLSLDLPIPRLIDVTLEPNSAIDLAALTRQLETAVPGTQIDDHKIWLEKVLRLARTSELIAIFVVLLIAVAAGATVMFATRTGLAVQRDVIEILYLIGARDTYIARQFQGKAVSLALWGGLLGLFLAGVTVLGLWLLARDLEGSLLPAVRWSPPFVAGLAMLPLAGAVIASITARFTVMRYLSRML